MSPTDNAWVHRGRVYCCCCCRLTRLESAHYPHDQRRPSIPDTTGEFVLVPGIDTNEPGEHAKRAESGHACLTNGCDVDTAACVPSTGDRLAWKSSLPVPLMLSACGNRVSMLRVCCVVWCDCSTRVLLFAARFLADDCAHQNFHMSPYRE